MVRSKLKIAIYLCIILVAVSSSSSFASESIETKRVLVLFSFKYGLSGNVLMDGNRVTGNAIQTTMQEELAHKIEFHSERMTVSALPEDRYFEELRNAYRKKYAGQSLDLIIAVNYRALKFLINHGEELWPKAPTLFCGVEEGRREQLKQLRPNITGVFANARFGDMLDAVLKIHPGTQRITMIVGTSETERFIEARIRKTSHKYGGRVEFAYLNDLGFDAILDRVADLPSDSIVFFLTLLKDGQGKPVPENSLHLISRVSNVPVYGMFDVYVGHGIVGGSLYSVEHRGIRVGELGVRILGGENPEDVPIETGQKHFDLYDWRQLKRWGISERDLPPGSVVRYRNPTFYEIYKLYIWGGIFLVLFEAVLITHLLINSARRRRAERELQKVHYKLEDRAADLNKANIELTSEITERIRTEEKLKENENRLKEVMASRAFLQDEVKHLDRLATMGTFTAAIAHEIGQPLTAILSNAQAAARFLNKEHPDLNEVREALDDIAINDKRAAEVIQRLRSFLKKKEPKLEVLKPNTVIQEVVDLLKSEIVLIKASVAIEIEGEIPAVYGDRIQIQQVVLNLLVNAFDAVKNQPEESREVRISIQGEETERILISVSDSGPGIEEHKLEAIFETFHTNKAKGMGMGLSICKSIIEQHDGRIWAANNTGQGAVITFTLPIANRDIS